MLRRELPKRLCRVGKMPSREVGISTISHGILPTLNDSMFVKTEVSEVEEQNPAHSKH